MTAFEMITSALRLVGVLANDETPSDGDANQALSVFNDMLDSWNTDSLAIYTTRSDDFPFVIGQQDYTLGPGGNFNMARPAKIDSVSAILINNPTNPVEVPMVGYSVDDWQNKIPVKNVPGTFPQIYYDTGDFPLRTIRFWPIPADQNNVRIYSWQALGQPADLTSVVAFPPGYAQAFRYNLAVLLAGEFAVPADKYASAIVATTAIQSLARIKTMNAPNLAISSDLVPDNGGWNYRADLFGMGF